MPGPMTVSRGNQLVDTGLAITITPPATIPATAVTYASFQVVGLQPLDMVSTYIQSSVTNVLIANAYVSAMNTLQIGFSSGTGGTVSGAPAMNLLLEVIRLENANLGFSNIPSQLI